MSLGFAFFIENMLLGIGLAMDAFSVSIVNGISEPCIRKKKMVLIAFVFAAFQALMPLIGWFCVHTIVDKFKIIQPYIPWIAFLLLIYIASGMFKDGIKKDNSQNKCESRITFSALIIQGVATSIDALSVGFTLASYNLIAAFLAAAIIATITFAICFGGVVIGKHFGTCPSNKSLIFGGFILVAIGLEILIKSFI